MQIVHFNQAAYRLNICYGECLCVQTVVRHYENEIASPVLQPGFDTDNCVASSMNSPTIEDTSVSTVTTHEEDAGTVSFRQIITASTQTRPESAKYAGRKRKAAHAEIVTSSPFKRALEDSVKAKEAQNVKKANKAQLKKMSSKKSSRGNPKSKTNKRGRKTARAKKDDAHQLNAGAAIQGGSEDCRCLYCQELYLDSIDGWVCCVGGCNQWTHELCAGKNNDQTDFVCELCSD